jgi:hypothetical protein
MDPYLVIRACLVLYLILIPAIVLCILLWSLLRTR